MEESRIKNVLIAVPALTWQMNISLAAFLCRVVGHQIGAWAFHLSLVPETSPVHYARNMLVGEFLRRKEMDYLWFIDHDMVPDEGALAILDVDADIVTGRCLQAKPTPEGVTLNVTAFTARDGDSGPFIHVPRSCSTPVPVVGAGAANLLIRRSLLEDPRMHLPGGYVDLAGKACSLCDEPDAAPPVFRTLHKPNGQVLLGEDLDFVSRAHQLGYRCVYQPASQMGHLKHIDLNLIEAMLRRERAH